MDRSRHSTLRATALLVVAGLCVWGATWGGLRWAAGALAPAETGSLAMGLMDQPISAGGGPPVARTATPPSRQGLIEPVVRRDIFGASPAGPPPSGPAPRSSLPVVLLATMVADPVEFSSALVSDSEAGRAHGYGIGDALPGDATIVDIGQAHIRVRRADGRVEAIGFTGATAASGPEAQESAGEGIQRAGSGRFTVSRATLDRILENPQLIATQAQAVPHEGPDGRVDGYRLSGIRQRSTLHQLGIRNGDVVHGMNGQPLTSLGDAMGALEALRSQEAFTFELTRRTKRQTFKYEVR